MIWNASTKPKKIGEYIILIPAIIGPVEEMTELGEKCTCSVNKAWFDGNYFIVQEYSTVVAKTYNRPILPECLLWTEMPQVFVDGWGEKGPKITWKE